MQSLWRRNNFGEALKKILSCPSTFCLYKYK